MLKLSTSSSAASRISSFLHTAHGTFEGDELTMLTWVETMDGSKSRRCFYLKRDNKVCMQGWTEWTFVDLQTGRAANISGEVKNDFPLVPADDPELKASGVRRSPSQS